MSTTESVNAFITEYETICRKHNLCVHVCNDGNLGIFQLDKMEGDFEQTLADWREENGR